ncbi:MAG: hypothetical protein ABH816_01410 [Candidatus Levyibacteriota bacterium]
MVEGYRAETRLEIGDANLARTVEVEPEPKTPVIIVGLGKMGGALAEAIRSRPNDYVLFPSALSSENHGLMDPVKLGGVETRLVFIPPSHHLQELRAAVKSGGIAVDFGPSTDRRKRVENYIEAGISFVMGATGPDNEELVKMVEGSKVSAVIGPNMAVQVVGLQAELGKFSEVNEGILGGARLDIVESHQESKGKNTSGTAMDIVGDFNKLGIPFLVSEIKKIRKPEKQLKLGVDESNLGGHGWHSYIVSSDKGNSGIDTLYRELDKFLQTNRAFDGYRSLGVIPARQTGVAARLDIIEKEIGKPGLILEAEGLKEFHRISPDASACFSLYYVQGKLLALMHNLNGRQSYIDGTFMALRHTMELNSKGVKGRADTMVDVYRAQAK